MPVNRTVKRYFGSFSTPTVSGHPLTAASISENKKGTSSHEPAPMVHHKLPDKISDPGPLLAAMRVCRRAMTDALSRVKPMGTTYHGLSMVVTAIDALAALLIGRHDYFWATGGGATQGERQREIADLERKGSARTTPPSK
jgi:hypothetical protein